MTIGNGGLIVIGENFNATRKIRMNSPKVVDEDGKVGIDYVDLDGNSSFLDCADIVPDDPAERNRFMIPHIS